MPTITPTTSGQPTACRQACEAALAALRRGEIYAAARILRHSLGPDGARPTRLETIYWRTGWLGYALHCDLVLMVDPEEKRTSDYPGRPATIHVADVHVVSVTRSGPDGDEAIRPLEENERWLFRAHLLNAIETQPDFEAWVLEYAREKLSAMQDKEEV